MLGYNVLFGPGLPASDMRSRIARLFNDPDKKIGIMAAIKATGKPPAEFSLGEANSVLRNRTLEVRREDLATLFPVLGCRNVVEAEAEFDRRIRRDAGGGAVNVSMFSTVTSNVLMPVINEAADRAMAENGDWTVAKDLTGDFNDKKPVTRVPEGIMRSAFAGVREGEPLPRAQAGDDYTEIGLQKFGEEIVLTYEAVASDQTGLVLRQIETAGKMAVAQLARFVIERVTDKAPTAQNVSSPYVYRPKSAPTGTALYSASARTGAPSGNLLTSKALVNENQIRDVRVHLSKMSRKDLGTGQPAVYLGIRPEVLLVPQALADLAFKIIGSNLQYSVSDVNGAGVAYNAVNLYFNKIKILSSPILDETSTSTWYAGKPQEQFIWKWRRHLEAERMVSPTNSDEMFDNDLVMKARLIAECEVGAIDYQYLVKCTA